MTSIRVARNSLPLARSQAVADAPRYCCKEQNGTLVEFTSTAVYGPTSTLFEALGPLKTTVWSWQSTA
jgi:hypothetical protein